MSDLYLVLRRRLIDVTDWVQVGTQPLHDARKAQGLSYEAMGRKLNVAAKTWERWEKAGRVPRYELRRVAELLDLEIDWPSRPAPLAIESSGDATEPAAGVEEARELRILVDALLRDRGLDPDEILRDARLRSGEPGRADEGRSVPGEAA